MDGLEQFKQTFFQECDELLGDLETQLIALEEGSTDMELLHAAFRAIHSIKGGAGAFGFSRLVAFAHAFETVLDLMREGSVELSQSLVSLGVRAGDVLADLVQSARSGEDLAEGHEAQVVQELAAIAGAEAGAADGGDGGDLDDFDFTPVCVEMADDAEEDGAEEDGAEEDGAEEDGAEEDSTPVRTYRIHFRPRSEMLRRANEPLLIVRQLKELGTLTATADLSAMPSLDEMEPDGAYLAWTFELETDTDRAEVEETFEFVEDDCELTIAEVADARDEAAGEAEGETKGETKRETRDQAAPTSTASRDEAPRPTPSAPEPAAAPGAAPGAAGRAPAKPQAEAAPAVTTIRVDLDRVDRLVNMVGEIVITQAMVSQRIDQCVAESNPALVQGLELLFQHTRSLQDNVMAIRAQPVRSVFARMPRLVRDLSAQTGKKIRLEMSGEGTEIDKTVIEQLNDPLTHMIRNAADHGIEDAEDRRAAGKAAEGTIFLSAEQRGGRIIIQIADDGRGVNRERVREKAIEKELIPPDANLSDEEIDNLIFLPGFSTAETISNISGRGVGMDVVRQNIQKLGGRVTIKSEPGRGSSVVLTLPLTLAVLDGMIVRVGAESYIIPLTNIVESLSPQSSDVYPVPGSGDVLKIRDDYVKLIHLQKIFNAAAGGQSSGGQSSGGLVILVEVEGAERIGFVVDEIVGQQQVVIKSLEENFDPVRGIAGATILGDGHVALILDATAIRDLNKSLECGATEPRAADPQSQTNREECAA